MLFISISMKSFLTFAVVLLWTGLLMLPSAAWAVDLPQGELAQGELAQGEQIFQVHCVGCHINGGNIIRRGKNLKLKALQRNGYDSVEQIALLVANGKNNMSAYRDRLTPSEIEVVSAYVLEQANQGWK